MASCHSFEYVVFTFCSQLEGFAGIGLEKRPESLNFSETSCFFFDRDALRDTDLGQHTLCECVLLHPKVRPGRIPQRTFLHRRTSTRGSRCDFLNRVPLVHPTRWIITMVQPIFQSIYIYIYLLYNMYIYIYIV